MTDPHCSCCQGATEGMVYDICDPCFTAIVSGTRDDHPHPLSPEQQALRDKDRRSGGLDLG